MSIEVQNIPVKAWHGQSRDGRDWREFIQTLRDLQPGQSFLWKMASNDRMVISITGVLLDRRFKTVKEGDMHRIGRIV